MLGLRAIGYDTREPVGRDQRLSPALRARRLPTDAPLERDSALVQCLIAASL